MELVNRSTKVRRLSSHRPVPPTPSISQKINIASSFGVLLDYMPQALQMGCGIREWLTKCINLSDLTPSTFTLLPPCLFASSHTPSYTVQYTEGITSLTLGWWWIARLDHMFVRKGCKSYHLKQCSLVCLENNFRIMVAIVGRRKSRLGKRTVSF